MTDYGHNMIAGVSEPDDGRAGLRNHAALPSHAEEHGLQQNAVALEKAITWHATEVERADGTAWIS